MILLGPERPVPIEHEVVQHRNRPCDHRRQAVVDPQQVDAGGEHGQVDDVATGPDRPEAHQLKPVVSLPNAVADPPVQRADGTAGGAGARWRASRQRNRGGQLVGHGREM